MYGPWDWIGLGFVGLKLNLNRLWNPISQWNGPSEPGRALGCQKHCEDGSSKWSSRSENDSPVSFVSCQYWASQEEFPIPCTSELNEFLSDGSHQCELQSSISTSNMILSLHFTVIQHSDSENMLTVSEVSLSLSGLESASSKR